MKASDVVIRQAYAMDVFRDEAIPCEIMLYVADYDWKNEEFANEIDENGGWVSFLEMCEELGVQFFSFGEEYGSYESDAVIANGLLGAKNAEVLRELELI